MKLQKDHAMQHSKRNSEIVIETTRSVDLLERRSVAEDFARTARRDTRTAELNRKTERYSNYSGPDNCYC